VSDTGLDELLAFQRRLVFGVLPEIAEFDGPGDPFGENNVELARESLDLVFEPLDRKSVV